MKKYALLPLIFILLFAFSTSSYSNDNFMDVFTEEEIQWLMSRPIVTVAPEDDYAPIEYYDNGNFIGLSREYLDWISEKYGIQFEYVYYKTWSDILSALRDNRVDLQTAIVKTPDRSEYLDFTDAYVNVPNVVLVHDNFDEDISIEDLFDYRVGIIKDYAVHEYVSLVYAPDTLYEYVDIKAALADLSIGEIDALILDLGQATYYVQQMALSNIRIAEGVHIDFEYKLRFASNADNKVLISVMNKAIQSIPEPEKQAFYDRWVHLGQVSWFDRQALNIALVLIGIISTLLVIALFWIKTIKAKDAELEKVNQLLELQIQNLHETQAQLVEIEKINALSRLVIGIAHEVNTPLGNGISMTSYMKILVNDLKDYARSESQLSILDDLDRASVMILDYLKRTAKIINDFKSVADYQYDVDSRIIELGPELGRIVAIIGQQPNFVCPVDLQVNSGVKAHLAPNSLFQIIQAMLENACIHAYPNHEGVITLSLTSHMVEEEEYVKIQVKDTGIGIPEDKIEHIFEPFFTTQRGSERIGLGLFSVHNIVTHVLKGTIEVHSKPNKGTVLSVTFPANMADAYR